ncbi:Calcium-binding EF-hand family protein [Theobroma cacao]|uniref:Calcium-binding EF-hand family protein n=2 Tax=Theobroma cacao TaxID=3641 RepID=A0A061EB74_THECC|nr:Calcium-binding EF-hand family protein [Theobroma cacao]
MDEMLTKVFFFFSLSVRFQHCDMKIHNVLSKLLLHFQTWLLPPFFSKLKIWKTPRGLNMEISPIRGDRFCEKLSVGEIKVVMDRLGMSYEGDDLGADELAETFDQEAPCLEEFKEAFDVFDENKDGFIDATELQRVLRCLGVKESLLLLEECRRMIRVADEDEDGRIDFNEFVKFMETCFL